MPELKASIKAKACIFLSARAHGPRGSVMEEPKQEHTVERDDESEQERPRKKTQRNSISVRCSTGKQIKSKTDRETTWRESAKFHYTI